MNWFERAEDAIEKALDDGEITNAEYHEQIRELRAEVQQGAEAAADEARDNYYGH